MVAKFHAGSRPERSRCRCLRELCSCLQSPFIADFVASIEEVLFVILLRVPNIYRLSNRCDTECVYMYKLSIIPSFEL